VLEAVSIKPKCHMTTMAIEDGKSISTDCTVLCVLLKDILKPIQADLVGSPSVLADTN
jgi:hypothetical protein